jgi:glycosyltransferase involved in cell wall biosynthesis
MNPTPCAIPAALESASLAARPDGETTTPVDGISRIALMLPSLAGGGAELITLRLAGGLLARGIAVDLLLGKPEGDHLGQVPEGVRIFSLGERSPAAFWKTLGVARYLRLERPDVLVSALDVVGAAVWARLAARSDAKVVMWVRTNLSQQIASTSRPAVATVRRLSLRISYPLADAVVSVSSGVAEDVIRLTGVPRDRVHVVYNPVVTSELLIRAAEPADHPWFQPEAPPVIVGAGRLVAQKDFETLLRAFARVRERQHCRLVILGGADSREPTVQKTLERLARELGIEEDVALLGFTANPYKYMARASVFVLSSIYEGFGNVVAEALALGTPVVATDCPSGPAEILGGGEFGRLVPIADETELAEAIVATLREPLPAMTLRRRGQHFSVDRATEGHLSVVRGLPQGARRVRSARA